MRNDKFINRVPAVTFDDVLLVPNESNLLSRDDANTAWSIKDHQFHIPFVSANMDTITEFKMAKKMATLGGLGIIHRYMDIHQLGKIVKQWREDPETTNTPLCVSLGSYVKDPEGMKAIIEGEYGDMYCVDLAHGDSFHMKATLAYLNSALESHVPIIAGNVCTAEGAERLFKWGADVVKVGVGGGSVCTTRIKTGCGMPQLQAIIDCSIVGPIIADGGVRTSGDAAKALAAGAKAVMLGGLLAGTDCVPGWDDTMEDYKEDLKLMDPIEVQSASRPRIKFRGMASNEARADFKQASVNAEGISTTVEAKPEGSTEQIINTLLEGVKSAMSYTGNKSLELFSKNSQFVRITPAGKSENYPHIHS